MDGLMAQDKKPSFQWYPGDWLKDPAVRSVSLAARGLWTDLLCLMWQAPRRGYLELGGSPVNAEQIARMTGCSTDEVTRLLRELENSGVYSLSEHGTIYSRRIVRDERKRTLCSEAGKNGGGNPVLTYKGHPKGHPKGVPKASSSSSGSSDLNPLSPLDFFPRGLDCAEFQEAWKRWKKHRNEIHKPLTPIQAGSQIEMLDGLGLARAIRTIEHTIAMGWQGLREPEGSKPTTNGVEKTDAEIAAILRKLPPPLNWGRYKLQERFADVGFDGLTAAEQAELITAYKESKYR